MEQIYLHNELEKILENYPNLKKALPPNFPERKDYNITVEKLKWYSDQRSSEIWNHMNLAICLWCVGNNSDAQAREFAESALHVFERFCSKFNHITGYKKVIEPLWNSSWDLGDPRFWSVLGEAIFSLFLIDNTSTTFPILAFERQIGLGTKTCDIKSQFNSKPLNIDIEIKNIKKSFPTGKTELRNWVESNALSKMKNKFIYLPDNEFGMIAQIYMLKGDNLKIFEQHKDILTPVYCDGKTNQFTRIYWIMGGRIIGKGENGPFGIYLLDKEHTAVMRK